MDALNCIVPGTELIIQMIMIYPRVCFYGRGWLLKIMNDKKITSEQSTVEHNKISHSSHGS